MYAQDAVDIPYTELRAITNLLRAHLESHESQMRAMIAFGPLVTRGNTYDIDLLEVVEGWTGPTSIAFSSTADLPLRGILRLNLLTPRQIEKPDEAVRDILERVRLGYQVIYENPSGYAERALMGSAGEISSANPLTLLDAAFSARQAA